MTLVTQEQPRGQELTDAEEILVSIVVPCRNERSTIEAFLRNVLSQTGLECGWEVLVADGGSDDGTRELLDARSAAEPRLRVVDNPSRIVSTGLNRAVQQARGTFIVRMDVHTLYAEDYVRTCLDVIQETGAQNVGGAARTKAETPMQQAIAQAYGSPFAVGSARFHFADYEGPVDTVTYGCWRRDYLMQIGLFDEQLVRNQDDELNLRITRNGGRVWQSRRIRSWYFPRADLRMLVRQYYQYGFWKVAVIRKHRIPASWRHMVPAGFVLTVLLLAMLAAFSSVAAVSLAAAVGSYLTFLFVGAVRTGRRHDNRRWPLLMVIFAAFHLSYGVGFLHGALASLSRGSTRAPEALSR